MSCFLSSNPKINLSLAVFSPQATGRREGYHQLSSLMARVHPLPGLTPAWQDEVSWQPNEGEALVFTCSEPALTASPQENLVVRAYEAYWQEFSQQFNMQIQPGGALHLNKVIPHQAGLGGGSSNAASTLVLLNQWAKTAYSQSFSLSELLNIAAQLGSDVPFFVQSLVNQKSLAIATGRGEQLQAISTKIIPVTLLLVKLTGVACPTAQAYQWLANDNAYAPYPLSWPMLDLTQPNWWQACHNSFEGPVLSRYAALSQLKLALLEAGASKTLLCGSGAAMAGFFADPPTLSTQTQIKTVLQQALGAQAYQYAWGQIR